MQVISRRRNEGVQFTVNGVTFAVFVRDIEGGTNGGGRVVCVVDAPADVRIEYRNVKISSASTASEKKQMIDPGETGGIN